MHWDWVLPAAAMVGVAVVMIWVLPRLGVQT